MSTKPIETDPISALLTGRIVQQLRDRIEELHARLDAERERREIAEDAHDDLVEACERALAELEDPAGAENRHVLRAAIAKARKS